LELGRQEGLSFRQDGFFATTGTTTLTVSPLNPVSFVPVTFRNTAANANNNYSLGLAAAYVQDQIEVTKYLQLIAGVRFDRFDLESRDRRSGLTFGRVDDLASPRVGVVIKPAENVALYQLQCLLPAERRGSVQRPFTWHCACGTGEI
jgi:catecholate siderophore receptor